MRKNTLLLVIIVLTVSCGKNKAEQMLYDYQQNNVKALNFDLADMDFKINKIDKVNDIKASDSLKVVKKEFAEYWLKDPEQALIDTLSFKYVKDILNQSITRQDTLYKLYQEAYLTAIRIDDISYKYESKGKRDDAMDKMLEYQKVLIKVESLENYYSKLAKNPDSILSAKYEANYSIKNPMLGNAKQTFDKEYYTNSAQTKFVKQETINKEEN